MKGFEALPELMARHELTVVFAMIGGSNIPWLAQGVSAGKFRLVKTRHEETAVTAAVGYARTSGRVGVCTVTRGPGFANSINALIAAVRNHVPIIMVVGQSPTSNPNTTQNIEQAAFTALCGAQYLLAETAADLPAVFDQAYAQAMWNGRPQVLCTGDGLLDGDVFLDDYAPKPRAQPPAPDPQAVAEAVDLLAAAERPLIIAGNGAIMAGACDELVTLAERTGAYVASSLLANRFFAGHPRDLGLSGGWSPRASYGFFQDVDVVLGVGASMNAFTLDKGRLYPRAKIVHCDIDPAAFDTFAKPDLALLGDARDVVAALNAEWQQRAIAPKAPAADAPSISAIRQSVREVSLSHGDSGLDLRDVCAHFDQWLPPDRIVVTDSGRTVSTVVSMLAAQDAQSWIVGRGYGVTGQGLGTAIGAAVACPDRQVALFAGDGGFMMSAQDLDAVRLAGIENLMVIVMNDEQYGAETPFLVKRGLPLDTIRQSCPDLVRLAQAYGGDGVVVQTVAELAALQPPVCAGLFIVDARLDPAISGGSAVGMYSQSSA